MPNSDPGSGLPFAAGQHSDGPVAGLQFQRAELVEAHAHTCAACTQGFDGQYFHAQGQVVCPGCAERIQSGQQAPPSLSLLRAALFGGGAALGGSILYSLVSIITGWEFGLMAIVVGFMVGKAISHASRGLGGRPQQVLAVALTYFAITGSYVPVFIYSQIKEARAGVTAQQQAQTNQPKADAGAATVEPPMSLGAAVATLALIAAAAPFLALDQGLSAFISLFIIFIGLRQAWKMTARPEILIMGPYDDAAGQQG